MSARSRERGALRTASDSRDMARLLLLRREKARHVRGRQRTVARVLIRTQAHERTAEKPAAWVGPLFRLNPRSSHCNVSLLGHGGSLHLTVALRRTTRARVLWRVGVTKPSAVRANFGHNEMIGLP